MIEGKIVMEDTILEFRLNNEEGTVTYTVTDTLAQTAELSQERFTVPQAAFFKALAIAVHNDGMPDYRADYADAEGIMGKIRWIP